MIKELKNILFLDIETVAITNNFTNLDERLKTQWQRKASYLKREEGQSDEDLFHERAGIYAEFGKIVCIAIGKVVEQADGSMALKSKAFYGHSEKEILTAFSETIQKLPKNTLLCAHNGKEFDYPYLCRRMLINQVQLPAILQLAGKKSWEVNHLDTLELWKFGDYKHFTSLDLLSTIFNLPSSKSDMDGSKVNFVYYKEDNVEKIKNYCLADVLVLAQLYIKMKALPVPLPLLQIKS